MTTQPPSLVSRLGRGCVRLLLIPIGVMIGLWVLPYLVFPSCRSVDRTEAVSPDSSLYARLVKQERSHTAPERYYIELRRMADDSVLHTFAARGTISFSADSTLLATVGEDARLVQIWRVQDGRLLWTLQGHTLPVEVVVFSPDNQLLASGDRGTTRVWRVHNGTLLYELHPSIWRMAFSPDGRWLATNEHDQVVLRQASTGTPIQTLAVYNSDNLAFSPDGRYLAAGASDELPRNTEETWGLVYVWRLEENRARLVHTLSASRKIIHVAFSSDSSLVAGAETGPPSGWLGSWDVWPYRPIYIWHLGSGLEVQRIQTPYQRITNLVFAPDSRTLFASGYTKGAPPEGGEGLLCRWWVFPWMFLVKWLIIVGGGVWFVRAWRRERQRWRREAAAQAIAPTP